MRHSRAASPPALPQRAKTFIPRASHAKRRRSLAAQAGLRPVHAGRRPFTVADAVCWIGPPRLERIRGNGGGAGVRSRPPDAYRGS
jgi:hypothetical protein